MGRNLNCFCVQCKECLKVLGVSLKNFQNQEIYCKKCGKDKINEADFENEIETLSCK